MMDLVNWEKGLKREGTCAPKKTKPAHDLMQKHMGHAHVHRNEKDGR